MMLLDVEESLLPVGAVVPFCSGMTVPFNCNVVDSSVGDELDVPSDCNAAPSSADDGLD